MHINLSPEIDQYFIGKEDFLRMHNFAIDVPASVIRKFNFSLTPIISNYFDNGRLMGDPNYLISPFEHKIASQVVY